MAKTSNINYFDPVRIERYAWENRSPARQTGAYQPGFQQSQRDQNWITEWSAKPQNQTASQGANDARSIQQNISKLQGELDEAEYKFELLRKIVNGDDYQVAAQYAEQYETSKSVVDGLEAQIKAEEERLRSLPTNTNSERDQLIKRLNEIATYEGYILSLIHI